MHFFRHSDRIDIGKILHDVFRPKMAELFSCGLRLLTHVIQSSTYNLANSNKCIRLSQARLCERHFWLCWPTKTCSSGAGVVWKWKHVAVEELAYFSQHVVSRPDKSVARQRKWEHLQVKQIAKQSKFRHEWPGARGLLLQTSARFIQDNIELSLNLKIAATSGHVRHFTIYRL